MEKIAAVKKILNVVKAEDITKIDGISCVLVEDTEDWDYSLAIYELIENKKDVWSFVYEIEEDGVHLLMIVKSLNFGVEVVIPVNMIKEFKRFELIFFMKDGEERVNAPLAFYVEVPEKLFDEILRNLNVFLFVHHLLDVDNPNSYSYQYGVFQTFIKNRYR
ncbi:hypothetical protein [Desulfurobacterium sp.]